MDSSSGLGSFRLPSSGTRHSRFIGLRADYRQDLLQDFQLPAGR
jgi:hypothetical protein